MYKEFIKRFNELENDVISALKTKINTDGVESEFIQTKALPIDICDYVELVELDGNLIFIDNNGNHYSIYDDLALDDLILILDNY